MDTFMDKLAQKLTAQEMIKANTAADAEEMERLKAEMKEYRDILTQMKQMVEDGSEKLQNAKVDGKEIDRLVQESIDKIEQIQQQQNTEELQKALIDRISVSEENTHKECVKVYRNVQAVVVEENGKQTDSIAEVINSVKGKLNAVLGISIAALVVAVGGVVFQVLTRLHII